MTKTINTLLLLAALGSVGCTSLNRRNFPEGHIQEVEYQIIDQSKVQYSLEEQVLYNQRYYLQKAEAEEQGKLPFVFYPFDKVQRVLDLDSNEITLDSKERYLPMRVEIATGTKDKWADEILLMSENSQLTSVKGVKANIISAEELEKITDNSKDNYGYKVITTEDDASYFIKTISILGEEYFFPHVADSKNSEQGILPFYLIPVKGAKIKIDNVCGNITIRNENNIYRPILEKQKSEDYRGSSIIDYLENINHPSNFESRKELAKKYEIENYRGTAQQNLQLLRLLRQQN